jgi:hypothetical protein
LEEKKALRAAFVVKNNKKPNSLVEILSSFGILKVTRAAETLLAGRVLETPDLGEADFSKKN